ncbi:MAG TPA: efflux RND transporter periplasmic adaptor subunit [Rudaea sp.]|nr:efflux RND transporter periplasmic adaptor subunit [Rudaea sp.]
MVLAIAGYALLRSGQRPSAPTYQTEIVQRGDLTVTVSATGNVQPTNQVEVGSELSGIIESVLVEENDRVTHGQVLAQLDVSRLKDQMAKSQGALTAAQALVSQTIATVKEKRVNFERLQGVAARSHGAVSKSDLDAADAELQRAVADEASAHAGVVQAGATLRSDETNLSKASIRSPIDGVVLTRKVEPGQTVAASLQAPVLFTLAEDLSQMQIEVDVDEADVGQVRDGQEATFTVDAYPNRKYPARIKRVDFGSQVKDGVVSYLTVLSVNNDDLSLRPGMTATAEITTTQVRDALLVPSSALRFTPPESAANTPKSSGGITSMLLPRIPRGAPRSASVAGTQRVWILRNGQPAAVNVKAGATDGRQTQIVDGDLQAGMEVITELAGSAR